MSKPFLALDGFYKFVFLYLEPISTVSPLFMTWFYPGATWFYNELIPGVKPVGDLDPRAKLSILQLVNCYGLLGLLSSLIFRAVRDSLPNNPVAQERIIGATFTALAIADITHVLVTLLALPRHIALDPLSWNPMTIGNVPFTVFLFIGRIAWFAGIGRQTYYYSLKRSGKSQ